MKWTDWMISLAGAWLAVAPFVLGYDSLSSSATVEAIAVGVLVVAFAAWGAYQAAARRNIDYVLMLLGGWSIVAPFALGYNAVEFARNNDIVVGLVVAVMALIDWIRVSSPIRQDVRA